jgi:hypothetical protein
MTCCVIKNEKKNVGGKHSYAKLDSGARFLADLKFQDICVQ